LRTYQKNSKKDILGMSDSVSGKNDKKKHSLDRRNKLSINLYKSCTSCLLIRAILPL
jgi:hypothetical protein